MTIYTNLALKIFFLFSIIFFNFFQAQVAVGNEKYSKVRIYFEPGFSLNDALNLGIDMEGSTLKEGYWLETVVNDNELTNLKAKSVRTEILIDDLEDYYASRLSSPSKNDLPLGIPGNFSLGSMGGFYKLEEVDQQFESMKIKYPQFLKSTEVIGSSIEDLPINSYCFGDCGGKKGVPELLLTAVHHAREPGGVIALVYFLWDLLERAEKGDEAAKFLLANRSIYVVPLVNPDGYYYNQTIEPFGGGMWRKNRRQINDTTWGIDLNRNYGPYAFWNAQNNGSSTNPKDELFRGTTPFSEPETKAIRDFIYKHNFKTAINYHSYGDYIVYPYGAKEEATPDSTFFVDWSIFNSAKSLYFYGRDIETVRYSTRGNSDDFLYVADSAKGKTLAMTVEIGNNADGFWPPTGRIIPQAQNTLDANYQLAWSAGVNLRPVKLTYSFDTANNQGKIILYTENLGVDESKKSLLTVNSLNKSVILQSPARDLEPLKYCQTQIDTFIVYQPVKNFINGTEILFEINIVQDGVARLDTLSLQLYKPFYQDIFINGNLSGKWSMGKWGTQLDTLSNDTYLTDSPNSVYKDTTSNYMTMTAPMHIDTLPTTLEFTCRWWIEQYFDVGTLEISSDNGNTWNYLKTSRIKEGLGIKDSRMALGLFGFSGSFKEWFYQECSLNDYRSKDVLLRFGLLSDQGTVLDGWFLKNIRLRVYNKLEENLVENSEKPSEFYLYPSPAKKGANVNIILNIPGINGTGLQLKVANILGQIVYESKIEGSANNRNIITIPTESLATGVYYIHIIQGKNVLDKNFIVLP